MPPKDDQPYPPSKHSLGRAFEALTPELKPQVAQLYRWEVRARMRSLLFLWLTVVPLCLWRLRKVWELLLEYFTWSALRVGLQYNLVVTMGIVAVLLLSVSTLARLLMVRWFGLSNTEVKRLIGQALKEDLGDRAR